MYVLTYLNVQDAHSHAETHDHPFTYPNILEDASAEMFASIDAWGTYAYMS